MGDEWLAKKKVEKVKRGRIVAVRDPKTIEVLELRVGYVKDRFGKLCRQDMVDIGAGRSVDQRTRFARRPKPAKPISTSLLRCSSSSSRSTQVI
jgi:hypothetical protein